MDSIKSKWVELCFFGEAGFLAYTLAFTDESDIFYAFEDDTNRVTSKGSDCKIIKLSCKRLAMLKKMAEQAGVWAEVKQETKDVEKCEQELKAKLPLMERQMPLAARFPRMGE